MSHFRDNLIRCADQFTHFKIRKQNDNDYDWKMYYSNRKFEIINIFERACSENVVD